MKYLNEKDYEVVSSHSDKPSLFLKKEKQNPELITNRQITGIYLKEGLARYPQNSFLNDSISGRWNYKSEVEKDLKKLKAIL